MNNKVITFIKNFSYTLSSNLISMLISTIVILIVPKLIGVKEYGYWQLYLFYSSYVGFLHFGWNDGIYLRYGGKKYNELNKELFFSQFWILVSLQLILGTVLVFLSFLFNTDINKLFILKMTSLCMLLVNTRFMLIYILQATNRIKEYAQITMIEKVLYCCLIIMFLLVGVRQYKVLILSDLLGKLISLIYATYCCKDIVFKRISLFYLNYKEVSENISVGIKLMFSNIASMLIIGIVQFGIEHNWNVSTFAKVSLTLSVSNLVMVFIDAVGIVLFPYLRRTNKARLPVIYTTIRNFLMVTLLGILVIYYPLKFIISIWLPQYNNSLMYMSLIFPMCIFEGKMALLINTYLKTLRKEKLMLRVNLVSVVLSIILTFIFTVVFKSLLVTLILIVILLAFRCVFAEVLLSKIIRISVYNDILLELVMTVLFILTSWNVTSWIGLLLYLVEYAMYLLLKRREIITKLRIVKQLIRE